MPERHRAHLAWNPQRLIAWAQHTGPATAELVEAIISRRPHPEQGYRSCLGIMRLAGRYPTPRVEAACRRALALGALSYRSVESIPGPRPRSRTAARPATRRPAAPPRAAARPHLLPVTPPAHRTPARTAAPTLDAHQHDVVAGTQPPPETAHVDQPHRREAAPAAAGRDGHRARRTARTPGPLRRTGVHRPTRAAGRPRGRRLGNRRLHRNLKTARLRTRVRGGHRLLAALPGRPDPRPRRGPAGSTTTATC